MQNLLTEKDVAITIKVSLASLRRWRLMGRGPRFVKVGGLVRYRPEDLESWMETLPDGGTTCQQRARHVNLSPYGEERARKSGFVASVPDGQKGLIGGEARGN